MGFKPPCSLLICVVLAARSVAPDQQGPTWTKTVDCAAGRVYRDVRRDAGREEFCQLLLPGSLEVKDGPSRWWYSEGHLGEEGSYQNGRKVRRWRECDRFDRCHDSTYELVFPSERRHDVKPEIPVSYSRGQYVFDFSSCWSTWVTRQTAESFLELNIGGGPIRCQITYIPSAERDRPGGGAGAYLCEIPYSVGLRSFDSLDLRKELPRSGLPQFCRQDDPPPTASQPNGPAAQAFVIWATRQPFLDNRTGKEVQTRTTLANIIDVECAAIGAQRSGPALLTVRLNKYAEQLVLDRVGKEEMRADACGGRFPLSPVQVARNEGRPTLFTYALSNNRATAGRQRGCIAAQTRLQPTCLAR